MNWTTLLPTISSLIIGVLTVGVSFWLGHGKQKGDTQAAFNDDLLTLLQHYEDQLKHKDTIIDQRSEMIDAKNKQLAANQVQLAELNISIINLQNEVKGLRSELDKFNRKVYYVEEKTGDNK